MRKFVMLAGLVMLGVFAWRLGESLSSDALGMAVGMVFGILAGIPAALLVLATSNRRRQEEEDARAERYDRYSQRQDRQLPAYPYQPPVIVVAGGGQAQQPAPPPLGPAPYYVPSQGAAWGDGGRSERRFKVVGEREEWIE